MTRLTAEGFCEQAFEQGLNPRETHDLLIKASLAEQMVTDPLWQGVAEGLRNPQDLSPRVINLAELNLGGE